MTAVAFLAGMLLTTLVCRFLVVPRVRDRAYDVCQAQALRDGYRPPPSSNVTVLRRRRRSPDANSPFVTRQLARDFPRPVFDREPS